MELALPSLQAVDLSELSFAHKEPDPIALLNDNKICRI